MTAPVKVLLLEDSALDAELILDALHEDGLAVDALRVSSAEEFRAALSQGFDLVLADYRLPGFDGIAALAMARALAPELPFLFVSGALGEERAIEALRSGATDYVLKDRLDRLAPVVRRALREREERRSRRAAEEALQRRAEELVEQDRRKDEFLAMLAHELRNPLASIVQALELQRRRSDRVEQSAEERTWSVVNRQVRSMTRLVDDLLDLSRITHGRIELKPVIMDLCQVARLAAQSAQPLIESHGHTLTVDVPAEPVLVRADALRLEQVLVNLLSNAAKYTGAGGRIALKLRQEGDAAVLRVRDNGVGIPKEMLERVFDLFIQVNPSIDRSLGGLGVGLSLVKQIVELHGGSVRAGSGGPRAGSEFEVRIPLLTSAAAQASAWSAPTSAATPSARSAPTSAAPSDARSAAGGPSRQVLLVEDNDDIRQTLRELLEDMGHTVTEAADGAAGLSRALDSRPDVALVDIGLPLVSGYELAQRLRAAERERGLPPLFLVALSGYGQKEHRGQALAAGFSAHLLKPPDPTHLERLLERLAVD